MSGTALRVECLTFMGALRMRRDVLMLFMLVISSACGGGEFDGFENPSSPSPVNLGNGSMSATIDGVSWNADDFIQARFNTPTYLLIDGGDRHAWHISIGLTAPAPGTHVFSIPRGSCTFSSQEGNFTGGGEITFTTYTDHRVAGTFTCSADRYDDGKGDNRKEVTNGKFDITF